MFRPILPFLLSICCAANVLGDNLLKNGTFADWPADSPLPAHWRPWDHALREGELSRDQDAVRFTDGAQAHQLTQTIPVTSGEQYELQCWKRVQLASFYFKMAIQWRDKEQRGIDYTMAIDGGYDAEFVPFSRIVTAPANAAFATVIVGPYCIHRPDAVAEGTMWVRDVSFALAPPPDQQDAGPAAAPLTEEERIAARPLLATNNHPHFAAIVQRLLQPDADPQALRRDLHLARLYPARSGEPVRSYTLGVASESDKLYPDTLYEGQPETPIALALAGNEYGSFQLAVIPFWTDLTEVEVTFSELRGPGDVTIPTANCKWFRVGHVTLEDPQPWLALNYSHAQEPDPLLPAAPFAVQAGNLAAVWVDLLLPGGTPAGLFNGGVTVTANGQSITLPITVQSYGFDIPRTSSIANEFWWTPSNWRKFYGRMDYTPELHAQHAALLGRYRISSFPCDWITLCRQVTIYAEADGSFSFDWNTYDQYVRNALANGTTAFWSALSCNSGWTRYLHNPKTTVIDRASGKQMPLADCLPSLSEGWVPLEKMPYRENRLYRDFLIAYVAHLKELGINENAWYELFDEPGGERYLEMLRHHRFFRELVPDLQLLNFGQYPTQEVNGQNALGMIDGWAPHLEQLDRPEVMAAMLERREKHGEKLWAYSCIEFRENPDGSVSHTTRHTEDHYSPFSLYHRPYIALRIHAWMAWKYQLDGFYIFMLNAVPDANTGKEPAARWPASTWSDGKEKGSGTLIYPGPDFTIIPGMRLANVRKGLEDYEYLALLADLLGQLKQPSHTDLRHRLQTALVLEPEIISSVFDWTKDPNLLEARRRQIAALILEAKAALTQ